MPPLKIIGQEHVVRAVTGDADAAAPTRAGGSSAVARTSRSPRNAVALPAAKVQATPAPVITTVEVTTANMIHEFEEARLLAIEKGQASAAVTATMAKAKLAGLLNGRPESNPEFSAKFDGNYNEAVRRIALLLRLADYETASGQKR